MGHRGSGLATLGADLVVLQIDLLDGAVLSQSFCQGLQHHMQKDLNDFG